MGKLSPFKSVLIPDRATGKLIIWEKPSASHPNGRRIDLPFTRSGGTRTVINNGVIQDVAADVPAWISDSEGCRVSFDPASTNKCTAPDPDTVPPDTNLTVEDYAWPVGKLTKAIVVGDDSVNRLYTLANTGINQTGVWTLSFFIEMDDKSEPIGSPTDSSSDFRIYINNTSAGVVYGKKEIRSGVWLVWGSLNVTSITSATTNGVGKYTSQSAKGFKMSGFKLERRNEPTSRTLTSGSEVSTLEDLTVVPSLTSLGLVGNTEGTLAFAFNCNEIAQTSDLPFVLFGTGSSNVGDRNLVIAKRLSLGSTLPAFVLRKNGVAVGDDINSTNLGTRAGLNTIFFAYSPLGGGLVVNGVDKTSLLVNTNASAVPWDFSANSSLTMSGRNGRYELISTAFSPVALNAQAGVDFHNAFNS